MFTLGSAGGVVKALAVSSLVMLGPCGPDSDGTSEPAPAPTVKALPLPAVYEGSATVTKIIAEVRCKQDGTAKAVIDANGIATLTVQVEGTMALDNKGECEPLDQDMNEVHVTGDTHKRVEDFAITTCNKELTGTGTGTFPLGEGWLGVSAQCASNGKTTIEVLALSLKRTSPTSP